MANAARELAAPAASVIPEQNLWSEYEIDTAISLIDRPLRNLKHGSAFAVLDSYGDVGAVRDTAEGVYYRDTRYLSHFELRIEGKRPLLLSSILHDDKAALSVDLANSDVSTGGRNMLRDTIFIGRTKFLWNGVCYERLVLKNFDRTPQRFCLDILFDADFQDLFEVRGTTRPRRGRRTSSVERPDRLKFHYRGLDRIERRTVLTFGPEPRYLEVGRATFDVGLKSGEQKSIFVSVSCQEEAANPVSNFFKGYREMRRARRSSTYLYLDNASSASDDAGPGKSHVYAHTDGQQRGRPKLSGPVCQVPARRSGGGSYPSSRSHEQHRSLGNGQDAHWCRILASADRRLAGDG